MNIKKELIIGIVGSILVVGMTFFYAKQYKSNISNLSVNNVGSGLSANTNSSPKAITLTTAEVSKHSTSTDCWFIINNSVYQVTEYLNAHPGGASIMIPYCGTDATVAYDTKDGRGSHSSTAAQDLASLKLGNLNGAINSQTVNIIKSPSGTRRGGEFNDD
ncbi:MAG: cytochrome b5-like heme/steroid binding domain-containing protein [Patescibacteria group bacterium]|jgi:cytochrome b involved in lipid metabolism